MMGPLAFVSCSVCGREYGSQSIKFHEPKCLEKWKSVTMTGPSSPQKTRLHSSIPSIETTIRWRCDTCKVILPLNVKANHLAACIKNLKSYSTNLVERPRTRTLERPTVLVTNTTRNPRPKTETLPRPTLNIQLPIVDISNINSQESREYATKTATVHRRTKNPGVRPNGRTGRSKKSKLPIGYYHIGSRKPQGQSRAGLGASRVKHHHYSVFTRTGHHSYVPMPCRTCHRNIAPEKLHSHGSHSKYELGTIIKNKDQKLEEKLKNSLSPKRNTDLNQHKSFQKLDSKLTSSKYVEIKTDKANETNEQTKREPQIIWSSSYPKNNRNIGEGASQVVSSCDRSKYNRNSGGDSTPVSSCDHSKNNRNSGGDSTPVSSCDHSKNNRNSGGDSTPVSSCDHSKNNRNSGGDSTPVSSSDETVRKKSSVVTDRKTVNNVPKRDVTDITKTETSTGKAARGLRTILCYICGREFGTKSLPIHEPQCVEKWKRENDALPSDQRRPIPQKPDNSEALTRDEYNEASWKIFQSQLAPCPDCGRTFFPDRLPIHQRACKGKNDNGGSKSDSFSVSETSDKDALSSVKKLAPRRCPLVTCYICGRQFGTKSIVLHEPQCFRKWKLQNDKLPSEQQSAEPEKPEPQIKENGATNVGEMEDAAWKSHLQQLVPCGRCGRTFFPDRLTVHERNCKYSSSRKTSSATPSHKSNLSSPPNSSSLTPPQKMVIEKKRGNSFFLYFP